MITAATISVLLKNAGNGATNLSTPWPTREAYIRDHLVEKMGKETGRKRVRKKKAQRKLRVAWALILMVRPIMRRVDYGKLGRDLLVVDSLPTPITPIYDV